MNEQNLEKKRKYLTEQRHAEVTPMIDCLECEHCQYQLLDVGMKTIWRCNHPKAVSLWGQSLYESMGSESVDFLNAPAQCPLRRKL